MKKIINDLFPIWFNGGIVSLESNNSVTVPPVTDDNSGKIYAILNLSIDSYNTVNQYFASNLIDLAIQVAGFHVALVLTISVIIGPIVRHNFILESIQSLYLVKTDSEDILVKPNDKRSLNKAHKRD